MRRADIPPAGAGPAHKSSIFCSICQLAYKEAHSGDYQLEIGSPVKALNIDTVCWLACNSQLEGLWLHQSWGIDAARVQA